MLTKDLIRSRIDRGRLKPQFVPVDDPEALALAGDLLEPYRLPDGPRRCDIDEMADPICKGARDIILAKGLKKIIDDQAEFATGDDYDYPSARRRLFAQAAQILRSPERLTEDEYRRRLAMVVGNEPLLAEDRLYADLPENDRLCAFKDLTARQLLERYNCGLVQGLLLRASAMELAADASDATKLRRLFKYLKFFRLLCRLYGDDRAEGSAQTDDGASAVTSGALAKGALMRVRIEGPASIVTESKRYGLQLACFFPAVCALAHWQIRAEVEWKGRMRELILDESSGLVNHYHHFIAYIPDEIKLFHRHFSDTASSWTMVSHTPFLAGPGNELIFPDLSFANSDGLLIHLELFHRWHSGPLRERLDYLRRRPALPLLLGVDRSLCRQDPALQEELTTEPVFADRVFLFRDYPTVDKTLKGLSHFQGGKP